MDHQVILENGLDFLYVNKTYISNENSLQKYSIYKTYISNENSLQDYSKEKMSTLEAIGISGPDIEDDVEDHVSKKTKYQDSERDELRDRVLNRMVKNIDHAHEGKRRALRSDNLQLFNSHTFISLDDITAVNISSAGVKSIQKGKNPVFNGKKLLLNTPKGMIVSEQFLNSYNTLFIRDSFTCELCLIHGYS